MRLLIIFIVGIWYVVPIPCFLILNDSLGDRGPEIFFQNMTLILLLWNWSLAPIVMYQALRDLVIRIPKNRIVRSNKGHG